MTKSTAKPTPVSAPKRPTVSVIADEIDTAPLLQELDLKYVDIVERVAAAGKEELVTGYCQVQLKNGRNLILDEYGVWDTQDADKMSGGEVPGEDPTYHISDAGFVSWGELLQLLDGMRALNRQGKLN